jgi:hypothetical protein
MSVELPVVDSWVNGDLELCLAHLGCRLYWSWLAHLGYFPHPTTTTIAKATKVQQQVELADWLAGRWEREQKILTSMCRFALKIIRSGQHGGVDERTAPARGRRGRWWT